MSKVFLDYKGLYQPVFKRIEADGTEIQFDYKQPIHDDMELINDGDYEVELLINPILNRGSDIFFVKDDNTGCTAGVIFPVSILDDDPIFDREWKYDMIYVAYKLLFERFKSIPLKVSNSIVQCFYEPNICISVLNKTKCHNQYPLSSCIQYLRRYGYSYFESNNKIRIPTDYSRTNLELISKYIKVRFESPKVCANNVINGIMEELPYTFNLTHRFVLLYQVVELLMEYIGGVAIREQINLFTNGSIQNNDFLGNINNNSRERCKIKTIFADCNITSSDFMQFRSSCEKLFSLIGYTPDKSDIDANLFYSFRNQMTHSYRNLYQYSKELADTIQAFERLILLIVERYPYSIK